MAKLTEEQILNEIPERKDVPAEYTWDLGDLFESDEKWEEELESLKKLPEKISSFEGKISRSAKELLEYLKLSDELSVRLGMFFSYASQKSDEDTADSRYQDFRGKALSVYVQLSSAASFADPEILSVSDEALDGFYKEEPGLLVYKRNIEKLRSQADHILSPAEETLLAMAGEMSDTPDSIGGALRNADLKWEDVTDKDGRTYPLTNGSFVRLLESPDQSFRKQVFESYYHRIGEFKNTVAATLNGQFRQLKFFSDARKYGSTLEAALANTEVPVKVYTNLIDTVHDNFEPMYKYVRLRKKMLGVSELHMYDVYTPIVSDADRKIPFEEAKETVLKALSVLGKDYTDMVQTAFDSRWIDVYENKGKRSGAYSTDSARPHPYVLLNYKANLDAVFTLAHEIGHSMHSCYSTKNQPVNLADYVIFVAEVASTVNEVLLVKYLLANTQDKNEKKYLINHFLDSFKGTLYRQTMFAEFELFMGQQAEAGNQLTAELLCEKYHQLNKDYFGPDMISDDEIALEWARIPHFFYNYYVYQYATSYCAAVAIADRILKEGETAVKDYKRFLSAGCSDKPLEILKITGVDMSSPAPIASALKVFSDLVDEFEKAE